MEKLNDIKETAGDFVDDHRDELVVVGTLVGVVAYCAAIVIGCRAACKWQAREIGKEVAKALKK